MKTTLLITALALALAGPAEAAMPLAYRNAAAFNIGGMSQTGNSSAIDSAGNIFVTGNSYDGSQNMLVLKYSPDMTQVSSVAFNGGNDTNGMALAVDTDGSVVAAGRVYGGYYWHMLLVRFSNDLVLQSSYTYSAGGERTPKYVGIGKNRDVYVGGDTNDKFPFMAKYSSSLVPSASVSLTSSGTFSGMALDGSDNVFLSVSPYFSGVLPRLLKYDSALSLKAVRDFSFPYISDMGMIPGSTYYNILGAVDTDADGNVYTLANVSTGTISCTMLRKYNNDLVFISSSDYAAASYEDLSYFKVTSSGDFYVVSRDLRTAKVTLAVYDRSLNRVASDSQTLLYNYHPVAVTGGGGHIYVTGYGSQYLRTLSYDVGYSTITGVSSGGTVAVYPVTGPIVLTVPSGTFGALVFMAISTVTPPAAGQVGITETGIGMDIIVSAGAQPAGALTLTLYYRDADVAGLDETRLTLARYEGGKWVTVPTVVYPAENKAVATLTHLSTYALVQALASSSISTARAYPMPYKPAAGTLTIDRLTAGATVKIFTLAGELVRELDAASAGGSTAWDGKNSAGRTVASGIYLGLVKGGGDTKVLKIAVEK